MLALSALSLAFLLTCLARPILVRSDSAYPASTREQREKAGGKHATLRTAFPLTARAPTWAQPPRTASPSSLRPLSRRTISPHPSFLSSGAQHPLPSRTPLSDLSDITDVASRGLPHTPKLNQLTCPDRQPNVLLPGPCGRTRGYHSIGRHLSLSAFLRAVVCHCFSLFFFLLKNCTVSSFLKLTLGHFPLL